MLYTGKVGVSKKIFFESKLDEHLYLLPSNISSQYERFIHRVVRRTRRLYNKYLNDNPPTTDENTNSFYCMSLFILSNTGVIRLTTS